MSKSDDACRAMIVRAREQSLAPTVPLALLTFELPGEPVGKERAIVGLNRRTGKVHGRTPPRSAEFGERLRWSAAAAAGRQRYRIPKAHTWYRIDIVWGRAKRLGADGDNIVKAVKDALNGVAYPDDRFVLDGLYHFDEEAPPGVWVMVTALRPLPERISPLPKRLKPPRPRGAL